MSRIYITRHGQPDIAEHTDHPPGDPPLSDLGRAQALRLGQRMKLLGFRGRILSSPYQRTAETADLVAQVLGTTFEVESRIREFTNVETIGAFKGLTLDQLREAYPRLAQHATLAYPWWSTDRRERESDAELEARVAPLLRALREAGEPVLLVGHGASVAACKRCLIDPGATSPVLRGGPKWNCSLTAFGCVDAKPLLCHDTDHLPEAMVTSNGLTRAEHQTSAKA